MKFNGHSDTERYLNAATRGLWGRQRRALRAELRGHITARVQDFRLGGLSATEAERQTLRELGAPVRVSGGMLGVYALPALGRAGALGALLMTGLLTLLPQGLAQVGGKFFKPDEWRDAASYLDFEQLQREVSRVGGALTGTPQNPFISVPGVPRLNMPLNTMKVPGYSFSLENRQFIDATSVIYGLQSAGAEVRLSGWNPLQLHANQTVLNIQTGGDRRIANSLYTNCLLSLAGQSGLPLMQPAQRNADSKELTFTGAVINGQVYALVVPIFRSWSFSADVKKPGGEVLLTADTNLAINDKVLLRKNLSADPYKLYSSVEAFQKALDPYRVRPEISYWDAQHPAPALLVKLTGRFGKDAFTVVNPATVRDSATGY